MESNSILTVFTPVYNRKELLENAYEKLCAQTDQRFEWLIIDDGSTDGVEATIAAWMTEGRILMRYYKQENRGKMHAHNYGVKLCNTELFVCIDSDDYLVQNAVEKILSMWKMVSNKEEIDKSVISGLVAYRGKNSMQTMFGEQFLLEKTEQKAGIYLDTLHGIYDKGFYGETTLIFRTSIIKRYPFPGFPGEKFIPEAVVYDKLDREYVLILVNQVLTICEYQQAGLTKSICELRKQNPNGWLLYYTEKMQSYGYYKKSKDILYYKYLSHAINFCRLTGEKVSKKMEVSNWELVFASVLALALRIRGKL